MPAPVLLGPPPRIQLPLIWIGKALVPFDLYRLMPSSALLTPARFSHLLLQILSRLPFTWLNWTNCPSCGDNGQRPWLFFSSLLFTTILSPHWITCTWVAK